ncbi:MAG: hypothetical protein EBU90_26195 [Proteobacteria bacterium]|nr:hypothetical protein [Pseudomonadota bacterium]NBP13653.1 hypothetical protein [bacterium]
MVIVEHSFTLDQLKEFGLANYPGFSSKSRARENAYPRQIAAYIAVVQGKYSLTKTAQMLQVTHATIIWSKNKAYDHLLTQDEKFTKMYIDFVNKFNTYLEQNTNVKETTFDELPSTVNEGESVNS